MDPSVDADKHLHQPVGGVGERGAHARELPRGLEVDVGVEALGADEGVDGGQIRVLQQDADRAQALAAPHRNELLVVESQPTRQK